MIQRDVGRYSFEDQSTPAAPALSDPINRGIRKRPSSCSGQTHIVSRPAHWPVRTYPPIPMGGLVPSDFGALASIASDYRSRVRPGWRWLQGICRRDAPQFEHTHIE